MLTSFSFSYLFFSFCEYTQENILYDEMTKLLSTAAPGAELEAAEHKFKSYITEYRDRAKKYASQINHEVRAVNISIVTVNTTHTIKISLFHDIFSSSLVRRVFICYFGGSFCGL